MDTGEYLAIDASFDEANESYRQVASQARRLVRELVQHTVSLHKIYHNKAKGGWDKCNLTLCRRTQMFLEIEGLEFE